VPTERIAAPDIILAGRLITGEAEEPRAAQALLLDAGRIERIVPIGRLAERTLRAASVLDCREQVVLPGLIDTHVHLTFSAGATHAEVRDVLAAESDEQLALRALRNAQAHLAGGVTTLRDCGGRGYVTLAVWDALESGLAVGPRVLACGPAITTATGHLHYLGAIAEDEASVRRRATEVLNRGGDFVKICATGGIMTDGSDPLTCQYSVEDLAAAVEVAGERKTLVAAHCLAAEGVLRCTAAGVRTIEHCLWQTAPGEYELNEETLAEMKRGDVIAGITFAGLGQARYWQDVHGRKPTADLGVWQKRMEGRYATERRMVSSGLGFTVHTDSGVRATPFGGFWAALAALAWELQLAPAEALRAATQTAARALGREADLGTLAPGKWADMVVVDENPLERLEALAGPKTVLVGGRVAARGGQALVPPPTALPRI